ncbi:hypothetical protein HK098_003432 [Nowakowskiella sp. JEL0407]|nr:hypothetical protein HK098_003432 [Nowakowskiella sp. JEL0407]
MALHKRFFSASARVLQESTATSFATLHSALQSSIAKYQTNLNIYNVGRIASFAAYSKHKDPATITGKKRKNIPIKPKFVPTDQLTPVLKSISSHEELSQIPDLLAKWKELEFEWSPSLSKSVIDVGLSVNTLESDFLVLSMLYNRYKFNVTLTLPNLLQLFSRFQAHAINAETEELKLEMYTNMAKVFAVGLYHHIPPADDVYLYFITTGYYLNLEESKRRAEMALQELVSLKGDEIEKSVLMQIAVSKGESIEKYSKLPGLDRFVLLKRMGSGELKSRVEAFDKLVALETTQGKIVDDSGLLIGLEQYETLKYADLDLAMEVERLRVDVVASEVLKNKLNNLLDKSKQAGGIGSLI